MRITIDGLEEQIERVARIGERLYSPAQAFNKIGDLAVKSVVRNFLSGGRPVKWLKSGREKSGNGQTLIGLGRRGGLMGSIHYQLTGKGVEIMPDNKPYAAIHQFGGTIKAKTSKGLRFKTPEGKWATKKEVTIPARPYMLLQERDKERIRDILRTTILGD